MKEEKKQHFTIRAYNKEGIDDANMIYNGTVGHIDIDKAAGFSKF